MEYSYLCRRIDKYEKNNNNSKISQKWVKEPYPNPMIQFFANDIEDTMAKRREIRNSTAEFLIFQAEAKEQGVEVYYKDGVIRGTGV